MAPAVAPCHVRCPFSVRAGQAGSCRKHRNPCPFPAPVRSIWIAWTAGYFRILLVRMPCVAAVLSFINVIFFAKCAYGNHRIAMGYCRLSFYHLIVSSPIRCPRPDGIVFLYLLITQLFYGWLLLSDAYGITPAIRILIFLNRRALSLRISPSAWAGWFFE